MEKQIQVGGHACLDFSVGRMQLRSEPNLYFLLFIAIADEAYTWYLFAFSSSAAIFNPEA